MVGFGALVGLAIAFVKEKTELASDTVIGVFFAGAIGFGAMLLSALKPAPRHRSGNVSFWQPALRAGHRFSLSDGSVYLSRRSADVAVQPFITGKFQS